MLIISEFLLMHGIKLSIYMYFHYSSHACFSTPVEGFFYDLNEMVCLDFLPLELWKFCSKWAGICIHTTKYLYRVEFCVYFLSMQTTIVLLSSNHLNV